MKLIYTTCTYNHIGRALALADSISKNCARTKLIIGLLDNAGHAVEPSEKFEFLNAETLGLPFLDEMYRKYNTIELNSALKPYFGAYILKNNPGLTEVIYLDSDILLYQDLTNRVAALLENNSVLLTPHALSSAPETSKENDRNFLKSGIYNAGFFAVKNDDRGMLFLEWWQDKVKDYCYIDAKRGMFAEQLWLNLVPVYLEGVLIVRDPGFNVAYWNLHERSITKDGGNYFVNQDFPLVFFHFSGADNKCIEQNSLSAFQQKYTFTSRPDVKPLFEAYAAALNKYAFEKFNAYVTIGKNFKTKSPFLIQVLNIYKKLAKRLFYR